MISSVLAFWRDYVLYTFFAWGSTYSVGALIVTLLVAIGYLHVNRCGTRPVRARAAFRALFPKRLWRSSSGRADIWWFAFSMLGGGISFGWMILSSQWVAHHVYAATGGASLANFSPIFAIPVATILSFVAYEFAYWFDHMLKHRVRWLWMFHRVHHSAESLSLLTNFRIHPVDTIVYYNIMAVVMGTTQGLAAIVLGPSAQPTEIGGLNVLVMCAAISLTHLQHSHFWITLGPRWGQMILSPSHHQLHHSNNPDHYDCNFGSTLAVFDRLFGSLLMPQEKRQPITFGIGPQDYDVHSLTGMTTRPFADAVEAALQPESLPHRPSEA
jgi:sterol desaturase/sphingolipid hydroxylase (fatty acid hydroxylase superfamily)